MFWSALSALIYLQVFRLTILLYVGHMISFQKICLEQIQWMVFYCIVKELIYALYKQLLSSDQ